MKTGKTLVELATEIQRQREAKRDFIAPSPALSMLGIKGRDPELAVGDQATFKINDLAHGQIAEYAGIPKTYYDMMRNQAPDLMAYNVNHWLNSKPQDKRLVRVLDGRVRALLSDRYRSLENFDLAEAVLPELQRRGAVIVSCEITERRLYIKAFDRGLEREIQRRGTDPAHTFVNDVCYAALCVSNSEVGAGALNVAGGVFTGGCTNFAIFNDSRMRKYHVGGKALDVNEGVYEMLTNEAKQATDKAIWLQTRDVVAAAFDRARFDALVGRMQETVEQKIVGNVVKVVELAGEQFGFNQGEQSSVLKHLIQGGDLSQYGLFNAVTRTAEDLPDYERATEFERAGGKIIELPRTEWQRIAEAA